MLLDSIPFEVYEILREHGFSRSDLQSLTTEQLLREFLKCEGLSNYADILVTILKLN